MSVGIYGTNVLANVSPNDVEIYYTYSATREAALPANNKLAIKIDSTQFLKQVRDTSANGNIIDGLYTLTLSNAIFTQRGIYNILIRPKQIQTKIIDCGSLSALPDVKGIVLDSTRQEIQENSSLISNGNLVGYKIEYLENGIKTPNFFRIVTSANKCEPITENNSNTTQKAVRYRFNESGTLLFLTVTPSSAPSVKPNQRPFIGTPNQDIIISNTYFNPLMIEVELVEHTIDTLALGFYGNQTKSIEDGVYSIYDNDNNIYKQFLLYEIKDDFNNPLYEVKEKKEQLDQSKGFDIITQNVNNL
jgi:hypothetical protein